MTTKHQLNQRKRALNLIKRKMEKDGWVYKKVIKNSVRFTKEVDGKIEKTRVTLEY